MVRSLKERMKARLPVSLAEIGELERYQRVTLGVAVVSNESAHCSSVLSAAVGMARVAKDALLSDVATEIITLGDGGAAIRGGIEQALDGELRGYDADSEDEEENDR